MTENETYIKVKLKNKIHEEMPQSYKTSPPFARLAPFHSFTPSAAVFVIPVYSSFHFFLSYEQYCMRVHV